MDYEKLYREANKKVAVRFGSNVAKEIFPDLYESEDEKIKKEIISYLKNQPAQSIPTAQYDSWLTWLEKPVNELKTTAGNWYVCDMEVMNENMTPAFHRGEVYYCPKDGYIDVNGAFFEVGTLDVFRLATKEEIPQQKQVWSEADEKMMSGVVGILESWDCSHTTLDGALPSIVPNYVSWLNSLRPQSTWKPSKQQIISLNYILNHYCYDIHKEEVSGLLEQLKKLREE